MKDEGRRMKKNGRQGYLRVSQLLNGRHYRPGVNLK
jgi:hypothetical protein